MADFFARIFGANWKTTLTAAGTALMAAITFLSGISYDQGPIALVIPPKYKPTVTMIAGGCTLILWVWNGIHQKSSDVTGGKHQQTLDGDLAQPGTQTLVDLTKASSPKTN
jgi:hypothetical protein